MWSYVGCLVTTRSGRGLILALQSGITYAKFVFNGNDGSGSSNGMDLTGSEFVNALADRFDIETIHEFPPQEQHRLPNQRFNDGKCDQEGNLWVGTMDLKCAEGAGALYCLDMTSRKIVQQLSNLSIPNGIAWVRKNVGDDDDENIVMYHIDSKTKGIDAYDFTVPSTVSASASSTATTTSLLSNKRRAFQLPQEWADQGIVPDGMAADSDGKLWVAFYHSGAVYRIDPEEQRILAKISLHGAINITACAFGSGSDNNDLDMLYVTTAKENMSKEELAQYPMSGSLFQVNLGEYLSSNGTKGVAFHSLDDTDRLKNAEE
eukprot:GEZU01025193.1.p1 GENE.GEZU01025193.1~~GEZU01025193.1.p1  ORF type:complete len:319 (-),score=76.95 GEZU01025193.1:167-1123(-)